MNKYKKLTLIILAVITSSISCTSANYTKTTEKLHIKDINKNRDSNPLYREFRAAWFSTVANIDWPLKGESEEAQKQAIINHLDKIKEHNFNAVFVQVKPDAGTIFPSKINPTTRYFFGYESTNERDEYPFQTDMLEFIIDEAHNRNIEVHAWLNPYRISLNFDTNKTYEEQFAKKNFIHTYVSNNLEPIYWADRRLYLDPGEPLATQYVVDSAMEIVENYDIDGIHFDDYFYQSGVGKTTFKDWPDTKSAQKYGESNGYKIYDKDADDYGRDGLFAWRRNNINNLVSRMYEEIKSRKPYVKWTISPAGVWRNKNQVADYIPADKNGSDTKGWNSNFDTLHADVLLWLLNGEKTQTLKKAKNKDGLNKMYIDALVPQIYWTSYNEAVAFDTLVDWWATQAKLGDKNKIADLYIGHALYRMGAKTNIEPWQSVDTMSQQVEYIRNNGNGIIKGSSFFTLHNMYYNDRDTKDFGALAMSNIVENQYLFTAIVPKMNTMKYLDKTIEPVKQLKCIKKNNSVLLNWIDESPYITDNYNHPKEGTTVYYAVYRQNVKNKNIEIIDKIRREDTNVNSQIKFIDDSIKQNESYIYYITALDRIHNESEATKTAKINF